LSPERGSPKLPSAGKEKGMRQRLMRLAASVGSIVALLVAGGARWKY
jgi:hypothetical protein